MSRSRRFFLKSMGASAGMSALYLAGSTNMALAAQNIQDTIAGAGGLMTDNEGFWKAVQKEFIVEKDLIMLNAANMTPTPKIVHDTVIEHTLDMERNCSFQNRAKYGDLNEKSRAFIAGFLGADEDEIGFVRNTSEANNTVINGLDLGPGDEVLIWDQNHPSNNASWHHKAERFGFKVVTVSTGDTLNTVDDLLAPFKAAINENTKLLSFSHISNVTGTTLPGKEMAALAHSVGAKCLMDGAQSFGYMDIDLHDDGVDFYTSSGQKWITGPREASFIYVKKETQPELWSNMVTAGWGGVKDRGARKYENLGQRDDGRVWALGRAVEFQQMIGKDRIEARTSYLASNLIAMIADRIPNSQSLTKQAEGFNSGVTVTLINTPNAAEAARKIYEEHRVSGMISARDDVLRVRLCPHYYITMDQIERTVDALVASI